MVDLDTRRRPGRERPQSRGTNILGTQIRKQVRLEALETLVKAGKPGPRPRSGKFGAGELCPRGGEGRALDQPREQVVTLFQEGQALVVGLVASGQQSAGTSARRGSRQ